MQSPSSSTDPSLRPVHLYVYDLSNGLARSMSMSWTGRQFDGIWHTSVVFDNQLEVFFGQGIMTSRPGNSHIGKPLRVIDQGETMIDPVTFEDYIEGLRSSWNAQSYHLLDRNCNNFSKEVLSFLNGSDVPDYILSLPQQFLSTPLGASMRPMIDQMFRLGSGHSNHHQISSSSNQPTTPIGLLSNLTSTIHNNSNNNSNLSKGSGPRSVTSLEALTSELQHNICVVVNFTNESGCPPCRTIAPVYRDLSSKFSTNDLSTRHSVNSNIRKTSRKPSREITFLVVDTTISNEICLKFQIRATPTFKFFLRNKQVAEVRGANPTELETQINLLLFTAYPPHPHSRLSSKRLDSLSTEPIRYSRTIDLEKAKNKLLSNLTATPVDNSDVLDPLLLQELRETLDSVIIPFLGTLNSSQTAQSGSRLGSTPSLDHALINRWLSVTTKLLKSSDTADSFPILDFLRLSILDDRFLDQLRSISSTEHQPIYEVYQTCYHKIHQVEIPLSQQDGKKSAAAVAAVDDDGDQRELGRATVSRAFSLTLLRVISNSLSSRVLSGQLLEIERFRGTILKILVGRLLDGDRDVKVSAAGVCFGVICRWSDELRSDCEPSENLTPDDGNCEEEWEVELMSALIECLRRETEDSIFKNIEMIHRLLGCIGKLLKFSRYEGILRTLIESLELSEALKSLLNAGGDVQKDGGRVDRSVDSSGRIVLSEVRGLSAEILTLMRF